MCLKLSPFSILHSQYFPVAAGRDSSAIPLRKYPLKRVTFYSPRSFLEAAHDSAAVNFSELRQEFAFKSRVDYASADYNTIDTFYCENQLIKLTFQTSVRSPDDMIAQSSLRNWKVEILD